MLTYKVTLPDSPHPIVKIPEFGHFVSLDRMNSAFSFNKYQKNHFWLLASAAARKNNGFARVWGGGCSPQALARTSTVDIVLWTLDDDYNVIGITQRVGI